MREIVTPNPFLRIYLAFCYPYPLFAHYVSSVSQALSPIGGRVWDKEEIACLALKFWLKPTENSAFYPLTEVNGNEYKRLQCSYSLPSALADGFVNVDFGL